MNYEIFCLEIQYLDEVFERGPLDVVELGRQDDARPGAGLSAHQGCHVVDCHVE